MRQTSERFNKETQGAIKGESEKYKKYRENNNYEESIKGNLIDSEFYDFEILID